MPVSVDAWAFARALLAIAEKRQSCDVRAYTERGECRMRISEGALLLVTGPTGNDESLGDVLLRSGDLDARKHFAALAQREDREGKPDGKPVGAWLLAEQLATRGAVLHALRAQLRGRMLSLLTCRELSYAVAVAAGDPSAAPAIEEPPLIADVLLGCLRTLARSEGEAPYVRQGELRLSPLGRTLLADAALWPEEDAVAVQLQRGATRASIDALCKLHPRAHGMLALLESLGGFAGARASERNSYGLLARKRNQIRQGDSPYRLLDLPPGATPSEARKALRQFALQLHPDALGPNVPDAVRKASTEIMGALIDAERALRVRA
jgi:hypothetical protein